jgi:electron-transferring-flavoprotein dehydrogenase
MPEFLLETVQVLRSRALRLPNFLMPPLMGNHGNYVVSLGEVVKWLGAKVEAQGAYVLTSTPATEVVFKDGKIVGVITGDKGVDKRGEKKANFEPGSELRAKVTVFGEGPRGSLGKQLGRNQVVAAGDSSKQPRS